MYNQQIYKKLFGTHASGIWFYILTIVTLLSLSGALITYISESRIQPTEFDAIECVDQQYCYIDVIGLDSEYIASKGNEYYYTVIDKNNYYNILVIKDADVKKMTDQIAYYNDETSERNIYQLKGTVNYIPDELEEIYADVYGLTSSQVSDYFGYYYLDTTTGAIGEDSSVYFWLLLALFVGLFDLVAICVYFPMRKNFQRCLQAIDANLDDETCALELQDMGKEKLYFGHQYLYSTSQPFAIKYTNIQWAYPQQQRVNGIPVGKTLILRSKELGTFIINQRDKNGLYDRIFAQLKENNPDMIIGYDYQLEKEFKHPKK